MEYERGHPSTATRRGCHVLPCHSAEIEKPGNSKVRQSVCFIIFSKSDDASTKNFAFTTVGTILGYWLSATPK